MKPIEGLGILRCRVLGRRTTRGRREVMALTKEEYYGCGVLVENEGYGAD